MVYYFTTWGMKYKILNAKTFSTTFALYSTVLATHHNVMVTIVKEILILLLVR